MAMARGANLSEVSIFIVSMKSAIAVMIEAFLEFKFSFTLSYLDAHCASFIDAPVTGVRWPWLL